MFFIVPKIKIVNSMLSTGIVLMYCCTTVVWVAKENLEALNILAKALKKYSVNESHSTS